jgi:predicted nuclease of predicted toxin-antitoxin system
MRILANENFPKVLVTALRARGHDVIWVRTNAPGSKDRAILEWATSENRILVTFDKEFGELAFRLRLPVSSGVILFRITTPSPSSMVQKVTKALESRKDWAGHFSVVEDTRIRMRDLH